MLRIVGATTAALLSSFSLAVVAAPAAAQVAVFPIPGTHYNRPATQITFRGVSPGQIGQLQVVGSKTGAHTGHTAADSDGQGGSFIPDQPFASGETVTVTTALNVIGAKHGTFSFTIANARGLLGYGPLLLAPPGANGVQRFRSRPDLQPAAMTVGRDAAPASEGDIFLAPQNGPVQNGPMILDPQGRLVWFQPFPIQTNTLITDFRVQNLYGQQVLTWWQGNTANGQGRGTGVILNRDYQEIAIVSAGNGLDMDLHEFLITPQGDAYVVASAPVSLPGVRKPAIDSVVQEIDIKTGLVLFEWHALDHIPLWQSYFTPKYPGFIFDPYHVNSIAIARDGNLIVSSRNTSTVYKIDRLTGKVMWSLGGKASTFKMGAGTSTWGQHDALVQADGSLTIFDDGAGPPTVHPYSRGIREALDPRHKTTRLIKEYDHSPDISADFEGDVQPLRDGNVFLGWGQQPFFSEDNAAGQQIFDARFNVPTTTYRAYRFRWSAQPPTSPALAAALEGNGLATLYASWNGATDVAAWRLLAGSTATGLAPVGRTTWSGFETAVAAPSPGPYFSVQALGSGGQVLASSPVQSVPDHIAIFGSTAFVAPGGFAGLPVGCYIAGAWCHITTTLTVGRAVIARSGAESLASGTSGMLYFKLSPAGRALLRRARGRRLPALVTVRDSSGAGAVGTLNLSPFATSGPGPRRSVGRSQPLQIVGGTVFVSTAGVGGVLVGCRAATPCGAATRISAAHATIARAGREYIDARGSRYLIFSLSAPGRALLAHARGNQLPATIKVTGAAGKTITARVALVRY
jgi:hypothetical protein